MSRLRCFLASALSLLLMPATQSGAQTTQDVDWFWCQGKAGAKPELRIARCTAVIESRRHEGKLLALTLALRANAHLDRKDLERAIADYDTAIELDPSFMEALSGRGFVKFRKGNFDDAVVDFDAVIRLDPLNLSAFLRRGDAYQAMKNYDRAIADYALALRIDPKNGAALRRRGSAHRSKGDTNRAIADYSEAITAEPKNSISFHLRGMTYFHNEDYGRAIADFSSEIALRPDALGFHNRGYARMKQGDVRGGLNDLNEANRLDPKDSDVLATRGIAYASIGDFDRAIADFDAAIAAKPDAARYYNRGTTKIDKGDAAGGNADIARARQLQPGIGQ